MKIRISRPNITWFLIFITSFVSVFSYYRTYSEVLYSFKYVALLILIGHLLLKVDWKLRRFSPSVLILSFLWFFYLTVTLAWTPPGYHADGLLLAFSYGAIALLTFGLLPTISASESDRRKIISGIVWGATSALLLSITLSFLEGTMSYGDGRIRYTFGLLNPNATGVIAFSVFAGSLSLCLSSIKGKRIRYMLPLVLSAIVIIQTDSRTATWCSALLIIFFVSFLVSSRLHPLMRIVLFVTLAILATISVVYIGSQPIDWNDLSNSRVSIWETTVGSLDTASWFVGKGLGVPIRGHSFYIGQLHSSGVFGVLLLVALLFAVWRSITRIPSINMRCFSMSLFIVWLLYSVSENILFTGGNLASIYVWSEIGTLITRQATPETQDHASIRHGENVRETGFAVRQ